MRSILLLSLVSALGCAPSPTRSESGWSTPQNGLQFRIHALPRISRQAQNLVRLEATCVLTNSGSGMVAGIPLARLHLVNKAGITNACQRREDVADTTFMRRRLAPAQSTSWSQDGQIQTEAGSYQLFAIWDGDKSIKSPPIKITIK